MSTDEAGQTAVSAGESSIEASPSPAPGPRRRGALGRFGEWFWRSDTMRELSRPVPKERVALLHRARVAADVARRVESSAEPFEASTDPLLCELYRQSIYWSLAALNGGSVAREAVTSQWAALDPLLLSRAVPDAVSLSRVDHAVREASFDSFALLPADQCASLLVGLRHTAYALIAELEVDRRAVQALWAQRILRLILVLGLFAVLAVVVVKALDSAEQRRDIARGAAWRTSSVYTGAASCRSPVQDCAESPDYFFHTQEEQSPWVEFDLGSPQQISGIRADNRKDCCMDRAFPLIVEVSSDQQKWQPVARRDSVFTSWQASFAPVRARWVRLRLDKRESFHLQRVRILR